MHPTPRASRTLPAPAWTYRYHEGVDELVHPWAGGEMALGFVRLTGDAFFTVSTRDLGPVLSPDTGVVLRLDGLTVLDRQLQGPASFRVGASDARFELAGTRDVEGYTALVGAMEDCRVMLLHLTIPDRAPMEAHFDTRGWMSLLPDLVRPFTAF
ncbi:MAG: hypothetical protein EOP02_01165 [Proteobacteria bacterium]|nr:MAG: hypothetical protein EOP02_01165 [Pseudomonadota bacterium]